MNPAEPMEPTCTAFLEDEGDERCGKLATHYAAPDPQGKTFSKDYACPEHLEEAYHIAPGIEWRRLYLPNRPGRADG